MKTQEKPLSVTMLALRMAVSMMGHSTECYRPWVGKSENELMEELLTEAHEQINGAIPKGMKVAPCGCCLVSNIGE